MTTMSIFQSQRRLVVFASTAFFVVSVYLCTTRLLAMDFNRESVSSSYEDVEAELSKADLPMSSGSYNRPPFKGITVLAALPDEYVPTTENQRRMIVIGDVHGMIDPLNTLLKETGFDSTKDHIVSVGDMVNKGPDSAGVVKRLMDLNASAVRGNHEDRVLLAWAGYNTMEGVAADLATKDTEVPGGESSDLKTARSLSSEQLDWLKSLPVILTVDPLNLYIVHAGLVPGIELERQVPWAVMNMRTLTYPTEDFRRKEVEKKKEEERKKQEEEEKNKNSRRDEAEPDAATEDIVIEKTIPDHDVWIPIDSHDGDEWTDLWNREQKRVPKSHRRTIVYGHDSKCGYKEDSYTFGLDSGCVKGGALSIIQAVEGGWTHTTVQVPCEES
ncbi:Metallo-dependent phosphatase-like protein [Ilyonectria robusta]|uniref:Metallo-dependent phosphatase-like protein n=1 Tax=Ilyonectria robusta TaxID=1079257 RepID=UPI001E8CB35A|nr:Metallo-dependent phosphatase-like protein [Ilyonectria robusta]KAH8661094.1 Metallo-dependent phosphatase-like protein [Ilyonectria robusta]